MPFKDVDALEVYKEYYNKKCTYEAECRILERRFAKEEQKLAEMEKHILDEHALLVKGERLKSPCGEVWKVIACYIDWAINGFSIRYNVELEANYGSSCKTLYHTELKRDIEQGLWSLATSEDKTIAQTTKLHSIFRHDQEHINNNTYVGVTPKGKCVVFKSWDDKLHNLGKEKLRIIRNSHGVYELKNEHGFQSTVTLVGLYEDYQELTFKFLL